MILNLLLYFYNLFYQQNLTFITEAFKKSLLLLSYQHYFCSEVFFRHIGATFPMLEHNIQMQIEEYDASNTVLFLSTHTADILFLALVMN